MDGSAGGVAAGRVAHRATGMKILDEPRLLERLGGGWRFDAVEGGTERSRARRQRPGRAREREEIAATG